MKKLNFKSLIFVFITALSISSFAFLMSQRSDTGSFCDVKIVEPSKNSANNAGLPDTELLKELVKQGKKYILINH